MRALPLLALGIALLGIATAGSARSDEATNRNLLERGGAELREAQRLHFSGQVPAARRKARRAALLFGQVEAQRSRDPEAAFLLIQAAVFAGDQKGARRWLDTYAARSAYGERDPNLHYARGLVRLILEQRSAAAVQSLEQMRRVAPRSRDRGRDTLYFHALFAEGGRLIMERDAEQAVPLLQKAARTALLLGDRRKELAARSNVGIAWKLSGHSEKARQVFDRLAKEDPSNPVWALHLALVLDALDRAPEAAAVYDLVRKAIEADPAKARAQPFLLETHLRIGNLERLRADGATEAAARREHLAAARRSLERFVEVAPKDGRGHRAVGALLYERLDRPYEAIAHLETAHRLDPVCDQALRMLIEISRRQPAPPSAEIEAEEVAARWAARREAWVRDYTTHRAARARERKARALRSLDGSDGCE